MRHVLDTCHAGLFPHECVEIMICTFASRIFYECCKVLVYSLRKHRDLDPLVTERDILN